MLEFIVKMNFTPPPSKKHCYATAAFPPASNRRNKRNLDIVKNKKKANYTQKKK